jgi:uncharacterized membrane protein
MSRYIAFTFETTEQAAQARHTLRDLENRNELSLYDVVLLAMDDIGRVRRQHEPSGVMVIGALVGALMGLVLIFAFTPVGILVGAGAGAMLATFLFERRIDEEYIADVERELQPDTSALLLLISGGDVEALGLSLHPFHLRLYQSTLPPQLNVTLRRSMRGTDTPAPEFFGEPVRPTLSVPTH